MQKILRKMGKNQGMVARVFCQNSAQLPHIQPLRLLHFVRRWSEYY